MSKKNKNSKKYLSQHIYPGNLWQSFERHDWIDSNKVELRIKENFINYWSNFFVFDDKNLEKRKILIFSKLCEFGICAVQPIKDDYLIYDVTSFKQNLSTDIISGSGLIVVNGDQITTDLFNKKNCVIIKANRMITPWFDYCYSFIKNITHALRNLEITRENSTKTKFVTTDKISFDKTNEIKEINQSGNSLVVVQGNIDEVHDLSFTNETDKVWDDIWNSLQFYMYQEGMRYNSLEKGGEVKEVEARNDSIWFEMIEDLRKKVVEQFVEDLNLTFNKNVTFKTIIEIDEEKKANQLTKNDNQDDKGETKNE